MAVGMDTANKTLRVVGLVLVSVLSACGGEVVVEGVQAAPLSTECPDCNGTATVSLLGLDGLSSSDPGLNIDVCVGVSCGQALVQVAPLPTGSYPEGCIADDVEVGCCFSSPTETMDGCTAAPHGDVELTVVLPLGIGAGTALSVGVWVHTMLGEPVADFQGDLTVASCGESCVTGSVVLQ